MTGKGGGRCEEAHETQEAQEVAPRVLSLGAGVQSTALLLLAARGDLPRLDAAVFADTGWEPRAVYEHLDRLVREVAEPAGLPVYRVSAGNIRADALDPEHRFASMPLYVKGPCPTCDRAGTVDGLVVGAFQLANPTEWIRRLARWRGISVPDLEHAMPYTGTCPHCDGTGVIDGMGRRQCTSEYKLKPIKRKVRELLGAPLREDGVPGRVPAGLFAEQWVGISVDERDRAIGPDGNLKTGTVAYERLRYPLLELGYTRAHCIAINVTAGFPDVPKSACIGCPFHTNRQWRRMREETPEEFSDAVDFDAQIRHGSARANAQGQALRGQMFLHRTRVPLGEAPVTRVTTAEWAARQGDFVLEAQLAEFQESLEDDSALNGCSPYACRTGDEVSDDSDGMDGAA